MFLGGNSGNMDARGSALEKETAVPTLLLPNGNKTLNSGNMKEGWREQQRLMFPRCSHGVPFR